MDGAPSAGAEKKASVLGHNASFIIQQKEEVEISGVVVVA